MLMCKHENTSLILDKDFIHFLNEPSCSNEYITVLYVLCGSLKKKCLT